ncbi:hypothetical protein BH24BAC1_BH24BAC1_37580 [soil metagenome]
MWRMTMLLVANFLFLHAAANAQTFPPDDRCTSKDLQLVGATLIGRGACAECDPNEQITETLQLAIFNKTNSTRTAFAFWGTLEIYDENGVLQSSTPISNCGGPVAGNQTTPLNFHNITYTCGDAIKITDLHLAWTDASPNSTCPLDSETINPKCGTLPEIVVNTGLNASFGDTDVLCYGGNTGAIDMTPSGGKAPYSYAWTASNGGVVPVGQTTSQDLTGLVAGTYTVTITDAERCTVTESTTITGPAAALSASITAQTNVSCFGGSTGSVTVAGAGGTSPYQYKLGSGGTFGNSGTFGSLAAGNYTVTVKDANDCTTTQAVAITGPAAGLLITGVQPSAVTCAGQSTGSLTVSASGGTGTLEYSLTGASNSWQTSNVFAGLTAGSYTVFVRDANGCTAQTGTNSNIVPPATNCGAAQGCTPGYWKNHLPQWTGCMDPNGSFAGFFRITNLRNVASYDPTQRNAISLLDAISAQIKTGDKNGQFAELARHAVAAYLNACHNGVNYPYTMQQIIAETQAAFNSTTGTPAQQLAVAIALADKYRIANERYCPLGNAVASSTKKATVLPDQMETGVKAYPNPFTNAVRIDFTSATSGKVTLVIYDGLGRKVSTLFEGDTEAGVVKTVEFNAGNLPRGIYMYRLVDSAGDTRFGKLLLQKYGSEGLMKKAPPGSGGAFFLFT